jgi:hypothetical protein
MAGPGRSPLTALVAGLIIGTLILAVARRRNWARLTIAVLTIVGLFPNAVLLPIQLRDYPLVGASTIAQTVLQLIGVALLFTRDARSWYAPKTAAA